ncbi:septum formation initiator family protein [Arthrobacter sp. Y-9]|uniref:FtsB family cell division protein n=1 Tax=Arthrobacter sp. Y-9 TaxID=3039385 RepID=UPI00241C31AA|nr:septum formation initiator family protein [Arthrobacter sp. Y-9]WFR84812.1 septum formation initiator family protein [Arthrobacter sp. Y-9]
MATRRPKVPRATLLDGGSSATRKPAPRSGTSASEESRSHGARPAGQQGSTGQQGTGQRLEAERTVADFTAKAREKSGSGAASTAARPASGGASGSAKPKQSGAATGAKSAKAAGPASSSAARGAGKAAAEPTPVPARAFSGRLLALGLVMLAITVLLAPTVKNWWDQRQQIAQLQEDIRNKQADQDELQKQIVRWHDPAYVQQQARDRINMVMPGEIGYWVFGKEGGTAGVSAPEGTTAPVPGDTPWTQKFLDSVREATK